MASLELSWRGGGKIKMSKYLVGTYNLNNNVHYCDDVVIKLISQERLQNYNFYKIGNCLQKVSYSHMDIEWVCY